MLFSAIRPLLFRIDPERAHGLALRALSLSAPLGAAYLLGGRRLERPAHVLGLQFPNRVGLAAGLDKNADYLPALARLGFGFVEVGTVTPRPQPGNERPRLFRLPRHGALINRMGFNNKGVEHLLRRVQSYRYPGVLGINIGKNRDTPLEDAAGDYLHCLRRVYAHADYVVVNISSPNTPGLRTLQQGGQFVSLLDAVKSEQQALARQHARYVPIVVKIAPDMSADELAAMAVTIRAHDIDAVCATNTTLSRDAVAGAEHADEPGGLSGAPLAARSTEVLRALRGHLGPQVPIIGVGGIMSGNDAAMKMQAGADLVQVYTGLIYRGPALIPECVRAIDRLTASAPMAD